MFAVSHFGLDDLRLDLVVVSTALALATLSYRFIEEPIRTMGRASDGRRARSAPKQPAVPVTLQFGVGVLSVFALIVVGTSGATPVPGYMEVSDAEAAAGALSTASGFAQRPTGEPVNRITTTVPELAPVPTTTPPSTTLPLPEGPPGPFAADAPSLVDPRAAIDPYEVNGRPLRVMIAGDSVGWSLGWDLTSELTDSVQVEDRAIIGCGVMPPESSFVVAGVGVEPYSDFCLEQDRAEGLGLDSGPDVVRLWLGAWEVYDHDLDGRRLEVFSDEYAAVVEKRLQDRIDRYRTAGVPTVMPTVPCFGEVSANLGDERHDERRRDWVNERLLAVAARNRTWVRVIDPLTVLCDADGGSIATTPDGTPIRADGAHFTSESAAWFWNTWLAGQLGAGFSQPQA